MVSSSSLNPSLDLSHLYLRTHRHLPIGSTGACTLVWTQLVSLQHHRHKHTAGSHIHTCLRNIQVMLSHTFHNGNMLVRLSYTEEGTSATDHEYCSSLRSCIQEEPVQRNTYLSETIICVSTHTVNIEYMYMWVCVSAGCCVHVQPHICAVGFTFWLGESGWLACTSVGLQ